MLVSELIDSLHELLNTMGDSEVDAVLINSIIEPSTDFFKLRNAFKRKDKVCIEFYQKYLEDMRCKSSL